MNKNNIILDCDPGHDDAVAIILAGHASNINLLGITTTCGNQTIEKTTRNALNMVDFLGLDTKVYKGSSRAILKESPVCSAIHGESGLDGYTFPSLTIKEEKEDAVSFIINTIKSSKEKVTMVTTGPMTNLALAIVLDPTILSNIDKIVLMGGSIGMGNVTPSSEFNIVTDPEAAYISFNAHVPIYMIGLDVTRKVLALKERVDEIKAIGNKTSDLFVKLMETYNANQKRVFNLDAGPMHDPLTIAYLIDNSVLKFEHVNTEIDLNHGSSYGRTNVDLSGYLNKEKNSFVAVDVDIDKFWTILNQSIKSYK